ncbi:MAG: hypothetical protein ACR2OU_14670 [Thermomicrobiales bacterium]
MTGTTRADLRGMLRRRLADTSQDPLWEDQFLDDAIVEAVRRYSARFQREASATMTVVAGDRELTVPAGINPARIVKIFDDRGDIWRQWGESMRTLPPVAYAPSTGDHFWRVWGGDVMLASPAPRSGTWRLEHLADRTIVTDDTTPMDLQPGDEDIHIALAMNVALMRRAIADGKRTVGKGAHPLVGAARMAQVDADKLFWLRRRRALGTTMSIEEPG